MIVEVVKEHVCEFPNPIIFERGDKLITGEHSTEIKGWCLTTTVDGNQGWAPVQYIDFSEDGCSGVGNCSYNALELNTLLGVRLTIILELNSWYLVSKEDGSIGWVPTNTVEVVE